MATLTGCASRPVPKALPVVYGYVSLPALVRASPGWNGLKQYDDALARLDTLASSLPPPGAADPQLATLPALAANLTVAADTGPTAETGAARLRLRRTQDTLSASLQNRREMARAEAVRRQQELWTREARRLFPVPARTAEISSDLTLQLLEANVAALSQTLDHWDKSVPPAPKLAALRLKVEADRSRIQALIAKRIETRDAARTTRREAILATRQARADYVAAQGAALSARLSAEDTRVETAQALRLTASRTDLLTALARPVLADVPSVGNAGTLALPRGPEGVRASLSAASLAAAQATLTAQRGRWSRYLVADTRAAALDAAAVHGWNVTFGPPRKGDRNLTAEMERALARD